MSQNISYQEWSVVYALKIFTKVEAIRAMVDKDTEAINHFRSYLHGNKFLVKTEHGALVYQYLLANPLSKLT